jgi:hypothetical protein
VHGKFGKKAEIPEKKTEISRKKTEIPGKRQKFPEKGRNSRKKGGKLGEGGNFGVGGTISDKNTTFNLLVCCSCLSRAVHHSEVSHPGLVHRTAGVLKLF